jgi:hypothetical protein
MRGNDCEPLALLSAEPAPSACRHGTRSGSPSSRPREIIAVHGHGDEAEAEYDGLKKTAAASKVALGKGRHRRRDVV